MLLVMDLKMAWKAQSQKLGIWYWILGVLEGITDWSINGIIMVPLFCFLMSDIFIMWY